MAESSNTANSPLSSLLSPLSLNALALVLVAVWLRGHALGNVPGVNGDEAWYGVVAWRMLHSATVDWHTPTGNPLNPLLIGPLAMLHVGLPPSIVLLRSVALAGGLAALGINWLGCRWVFDRRTAAISTVALAILPIDIAYSRFAWDASQSLAATLPVVYLALAAVRFPDRFGRWIAASLLALAVAFWVHPTNILAGAAILVACACAVWHRLTAKDTDEEKMTNDEIEMTNGEPSPRPSFVISISSFVILSLAGLLAATWVCTAQWARGPLPGQIAERLSNLRELAQPSDLPPASVLYARLFTGGTVYRYLAGSRSWFEWPLPAELDGWGLDVGVFWVCAFGSVWLLWQFGRDQRSRLCDGRLRLRNRTDRALLAAWALQIAAFLAVAGPRAMAPGQERFAICLIGPAVLLLARGATLAWEAASTRWRIVLAAATLAGWPLLADFHAHYFQFIEQTGGQAHLTFRTAAVEPKLAALQCILDNAGEKAEVWIVCSEWWNRWPIRYLALPHPGVCVPEPKDIDASDDYRRALAEGRVWFVEFCNSQAERQVKSQMAGGKATYRQFLDYSGRPLLGVLHPTPMGSKNQ